MLETFLQQSKKRPTLVRKSVSLFGRETNACQVGSSRPEIEWSKEKVAVVAANMIKDPESTVVDFSSLLRSGQCIDPQTADRSRLNFKVGCHGGKVRREEDFTVRWDGEVERWPKEEISYLAPRSLISHRRNKLPFLLMWKCITRVDIVTHTARLESQ